jgi:zinc protease
MTIPRLRAALAGGLIGVVAVAAAVVAQTPPAGRETSAASVAAYKLSETMPVDPEVRTGTLPNGLRYYVRPNGRPANRAELRLVVKAGSVLEDEDQRGLAHFVEHMLFEGTEHFPGRSLVDFLSSLGLTIGADANASTGYDETQYILRVPTDVPGVLDRALLVLQDWAGAATFDQAGIDHERGIVLSEWRMNLGAGERIQNQIRSIQLQGSRYAVRPPIGDPDIIASARREQLLRFYHDWYRPDLMAVIVVGDVDRDEVESMIKAHFSSLTAPSPERPRPAYDVPEHDAMRYAVVTDKETTSTVVELSNLRPARNQGTVGGYRDIMLDQLFSSMLGDRLSALTVSARPPFLQAAAGRSLFQTPRTRDEAVLQALVANDGVPAGLDALVTELERVRRYGFTAPELERAKQAMMSSYERIVTESPDRESESRADEYTRNFLEDEALPTIWQELAFHRRFLPEVTLQDVNALAADWFPGHNGLVVVSGPDAAGVTLPDQAALASVVKTAEARTLEPYVDGATSHALMETPPKPGTIVATTEHPEAGITEWRLSNGATVVLKPTTLRADQILCRAAAPGGTAPARDADLMPARVASAVVEAGGVGSFNAVALDRLLAGKAVAVSSFIDEFDQGMQGGSTPPDLETMFQLLHLRFTAPRADPTAFAALASQARALLANQMASPEVVFNQAIDAALDGGSPRRAPATPASVDQWDLDKSMAFYRARFADAGNFTFVFVGSFTVDAIRPFVEQYIASLPSTGAHETWRDLGIRPPTGVVTKTVRKGIAPKSEVALVFSGPFQYDDAHRLALRTAAMVLQSRLFDTIRQELGGTYSITVDPEMDKIPRPEYRVRIDWTCDPAKADMLTRRVLEEIAFVKNTPLSDGQVAAIRQGLLRNFQQNSQDNGYLLNQIARRYEDGDGADVASVVNLPARIAALTGEEVRAAAQAYLDTNRYVQVTLMPDGQ